MTDGYKAGKCMKYK